MFEAEWIQAMQEKTSQVIADLLPKGTWFQLVNDYPMCKSAWCIIEKEEEVVVKSIVWNIVEDNRKYFGPGYAARLLISSFEPNLTIVEKKLDAATVLLYQNKRQQIQLHCPINQGILLGHQGTSIVIKQSSYQLNITCATLEEWPHLSQFVDWLEHCLVEE